MWGALTLVTIRQWGLHKLRLALTVAGIALGVAVFFAVRTANTTLVGSLSTTVEKLAGQATLQVSAGEVSFPQDNLKIVRATAGVKFAEPVIERVVQTGLPDSSSLLVVGLDTGSALKLYEGEFDQAGLEISNPLAFTERTDSIAISRPFAERYGLKEGDHLPVYTQKGKQDFTVRGFFRTSGASVVFGGNLALMDIYAAQAAFDRPDHIDRIDIMTEPGVAVEKVEQDLRGKLAAGLEVARPDRRGQNLEKAVSAMRLGLFIMSLLALMVGVFIIFNSLSVSVNQRWKEIGVLRAIGVEGSHIQKMFLIESVLMGLVGSAAGVVIGFLMARGATKIMSSVVASMYGLAATADSPDFHWDFAITAFVIGVFASLLGTWLPARAASRLDPVAALRNVELQRREGVLGWSRFGLGILFIVVGLSLTFFSPPAVGLMVHFTYSIMVQFGMVLLLPKLVVWGSQLLRPIMGLLFGAEGLIALDAAARMPRRTSATVGALMLGLSFVFSVGAFITSHKAALNRMLDRAVNADLMIATSEQMRSRTYHFSEEQEKRVAALPGVKNLDALRVTGVTSGSDDLIVIGRNMDLWFSNSPGLLDEGNETTARQLTSRGEGFVISQNQSVRSGIGLGNYLRLDTPAGPLVRPVVGVLEFYYVEKGTVFMDRELYKKYWGDNSVDLILLNLQPGLDRNAFKAEINRAMQGEQRAFIYTSDEYKAWSARLTDQFFTLTYLEMLIAIFVAAMGLINMLIISVSERQRELGILRAVGVLRSQVRRMVLLESAAIALVGFATGIIAGLFNAYFLVRTAARIIAGFNLRFQFAWTVVLACLPIVLLVALGAAWWTAQRALRLSVVEAIGYE
ncbi:MAG TPA: FtsX-like permease family protein [Pyrinomonadaceae bacterium]|nr:FtsX-like permease family protein [Pyrinomonadaceae bacterium]